MTSFPLAANSTLIDLAEEASFFQLIHDRTRQTLQVRKQGCMRYVHAIKLVHCFMSDLWCQQYPLHETLLIRIFFQEAVERLFEHAGHHQQP
jgi:hypothetical protein